MPDVEEITSALVIRPGDVLLVGLAAERLTNEQADMFKREIKAKLPDLADVVLITQVSVLASYRPEAVDA
jgi:hypothetical protein